MPIENVENVNFTCTVNTTYMVSQYTWFLDGNEIAGETNATYQLIGSDRSKSGKYSCSVNTTVGRQSTSSVKMVTFQCK